MLALCGCTEPRGANQFPSCHRGASEVTPAMLLPPGQLASNPGFPLTWGAATACPLSYKRDSREHLLSTYVH